MALDLVSAAGAPIRQLDLGPSDYLEQSPKFKLGNSTRRYNSTLLIAMAKLYPIGNNLLLVPLEISGLPILELSEHGTVKSVVPQLPDGTIIDSVIPSSSSILKVRMGRIVETEHPALDSEGDLLSVGTTPSERITELSLKDGTIVRETDIGSAAVQPACEAGGALRLLTSSGSAGKLAVVTTPVP